MGEFSLTHILLLAVIALFFFGPSRLPQLGQSLGKAIRGFKTGLSEIDVDAKDIHDTAMKPNQQANPNSQIHAQQNSQTIVPPNAYVTPGSVHGQAQTEAQKQADKQNT